jgi:signal transduction histidine kinase
MMLSKFIVQNLEQILEAWESFARRLLPATEGMDAEALRDHGKQILEAVARDMETPQTDEQQFRKSVGLSDEGSESAASIHGSLRQESDFTMMQLAAEYRALRATVLRLWVPQIDDLGTALDDIIRFNEAIDQALAESIVTFTGRTARARDMFIAMLGHDLRAPLATMATAGHMLGHPRLSADRAAELGARISRGASLMSKMVDDLADYTRTQLGNGLPLSRRHLDLRDTCAWALDDARSLHPEVDFDFRADGDLRGSFDGVRLHRLLTNLLGNACQHGQKGSPVVLQAARQEDDIVVTVTNHGNVIPPDSLKAIFEPMVQLAVTEGEAVSATSMGLGLFISRIIVEAHGGDISVMSAEAPGTTFTVRLPVQPGAAGASGAR